MSNKYYTHANKEVNLYKAAALLDGLPYKNTSSIHDCLLTGTYYRLNDI